MSAPTPWQVSATQIKAYISCQRKWALTWLAKVPRVESPALQFGNDVHASLAQYRHDPSKWNVAPESAVGQLTQDMSRCVPDRASDGSPYDLVEIEAAAPGPPGTDRERWVYQYVRGEYVGLVRSPWHVDVPDVAIGGPVRALVRPDVVMVHGSAATVIDWKTTAAPNAGSPWVLSSRSMWADRVRPSDCKLLWDDVQYRLYLAGCFDRWPELIVATGRWIYGSKRLHGTHYPTWAVSETLDAPEARSFADAVLWPTVRSMSAVRAAWQAGAISSPTLVPHDGSACEYRGRFCDGMSHCGFVESPIPRSALALPILPK